MSKPGLDLLLRVIGDRLGSRACSGCHRPLSDPRVDLLEQGDDVVVIEVCCRVCGEHFRLRIEPEIDSGIAGIG